MDDDILMTSFFTWLEENGEALSYPVTFESAENLRLNFLLDEQYIKINFEDFEISSSSKNSAIKSWIEWASQTLQDCASDLLTGDMQISKFLDKIINKYSEYKEFASDNDFGSDTEMDLDYHDEIIEAENERLVKTAQRTGKSDASFQGLPEFAQNHFIFREAAEAVELLNETFNSCPDLRHSCKITNNPVLSNIRLEIDLAFLDIPDSVMIMLELTYESPLVISITINDNRIIQTLDEIQWTPALLGSLNFEVLQGGSMDSYGCREYILGRVRKYRDDVYNAMKSKGGSSALSLSRENSIENAKYKTTANKNLVKQMVTMGFPKDLATEALQLSQNDLDAALDIANTGVFSSYRGEFAEAIIPCNNFFYNMLFYMRDRIQNCTNYCFICYKKHNCDSIRLRACNQEICEFRFEEISGLSIYAELKNNINLIMLDLSFASEAAASARAQTVFEPFPSFLLKKEQMRGKAGFLSRTGGQKYTSEMDNNKDIEYLRVILRSMPNPHMLKDQCSDELALRDYLATLIGENSMMTYKLLRYIIATNRLALVRLDGEWKIKKLDEGIQQYIVTNHSPEAEREFNRLKQKHGSFFAFHGSAIENWYSILRNGIRNLSNTHMMTAGAAAGPGVYSAENMGTSLGYSRMSDGGSIWPYGILHNPPTGCMAIIEVIKNNKNYNTGRGVYVIQNDKELIIRYLLLWNSSDYNKLNANANDLELTDHLKKFEKAFAAKKASIRKARIDEAIRKSLQKAQTENRSQKMFEEQKSPQVQRADENQKDIEAEEKIKKIEKAFSGQGSATSNKRILQEYRYLLKSKECKGLVPEFEGGSNMYIWQVHLNVTQFEIPKDLQKEFEAYSKRYGREKEILFEVRFDANFPFNPPFVRIVRPRFAFHTGHVTIGGSICMQSLTPSGWIPVRTVESIFIEILFNMLEGGAKLDPNQSYVDYSLGEAQEAFDRVARQHNWLN